MNQKKKVSIIIPVYKTKKDSLDICITSITDQEYKEYEIIIVDDGNDSDYARMLDEYAHNRHITVVHQKNAGASSARNRGIAKATGEFIVFVDSDDKIAKGFLSQGVTYMENYNLDIVLGGYTVDGKEHIPLCEQIKIYDEKNIRYLKEFFVSGFGTSETMELKNCLGFVAPWGKIFRKEAVEEVRFDEKLILSEDNLYNLYCIEKAKRIGIVPKCWYDYFVTDGSICHKYRKNAFEEIRLSMDGFEKFVKDSTEPDAIFESALGYRMLRQLDSILKYYICNYEYDEKKPVHKLKQFLKINHYKSVKADKRFYISKGYNILFLLAKIEWAAGIYFFYKLKERSKK